MRYATLDLSGPYRKVFNAMVPEATQVADPFHVVKLANTKLDECRRRVQNETIGHRGHKTDPLYRCRRLLTKAEERLDDQGREKLLGLLRAGDPQRRRHHRVARQGGRPRALRPRQIPTSPLEWIDRARRRPARTRLPDRSPLTRTHAERWKHQIAAWHAAHVSNGPTEAVNNLIKRVKRAAFGFTSFRNYRIRLFSTPGSPTGTCSPRSHPAEIRRAR